MALLKPVAHNATIGRTVRAGDILTHFTIVLSTVANANGFADVIRDAVIVVLWPKEKTPRPQLKLIFTEDGTGELLGSLSQNAWERTGDLLAFERHDLHLPICAKVRANVICTAVYTGLEEIPFEAELSIKLFVEQAA